MIKQISQYLFGTGSYKFYERHRNFYREFLGDSTSIRKAIKSLNIREATDIGISKILPSFIDIASIALSYGFGEPSYLTGIGLGEAIRLFSSGIFNAERAGMEANRLSVYSIDTIREDIGIKSERKQIPDIGEICNETELLRGQINDYLESY